MDNLRYRNGEYSVYEVGFGNRKRYKTYKNVDLGEYADYNLALARTVLDKPFVWDWVLIYMGLVVLFLSYIKATIN